MPSFGITNENLFATLKTYIFPRVCSYVMNCFITGEQSELVPLALQFLYSYKVSRWLQLTFSFLSHPVSPFRLSEGWQTGLSAAVVWDWGRGGHAAIPHLMSCSAPHRPSTSLPSNPSGPAGCSEIFPHCGGTVFSAYESCRGLTCTHQAMQTWCCQQNGALNHHSHPWTRRRVSCVGS